MGCARAPNPQLVLIVEDDSAIADFIADVVAIAGARSVIAGDGLEALLLARAHRPALVITDLNMPRMSGAALIAALRKEWGVNLPVILVSAAPRTQLLAAGAVALLAKPFAVADLLALLDRFLPRGSAYHPAA
jgi:DNA-binding response OmpR family regulator